MAKCIVVWDDEQGVCWPCCLDPDCEGAIYCGGGPVALFPNRKAAQRAIRVTANYAKLRQSQGKVANDDFLGPCKKNVRIRPVEEIHEEQ